jgi:hypothetical protein
MFYVVVLTQGADVRVMGFQSDLVSAMRVAEVLGPGAEYERLEGAYPADELAMAKAYEEHRKRHGLRLVSGGV